MRVCIHCREAKPLTAFWKDKGLCMKCTNRESTDRLRKVIDAAKSVPCMDCGESFKPHIMEFDHRIPADKESGVGTNHRSLKKLLAEMAKCDTVCANCHNERTWVRRQP
jgi:NAD-dependent SIR2 family protein deacetylase